MNFGVKKSSNLYKGCILDGNSPLLGEFRLIKSSMADMYLIYPIVPAALWILPLITDSIIFLLTLHRSRRYWKNSGNTPCVLHPMTFILFPIYHGVHHRTIFIFARDGTMYFLVICMTNLLNTLVFFVSVRHRFRFHYG